MARSSQGIKPPSDPERFKQTPVTGFNDQLAVLADVLGRTWPGEKRARRLPGHHASQAARRAPILTIGSSRLDTTNEGV